MAIVLIDLLELKPGVTPQEAHDYFGRAMPFLERNGIRRIDSMLEVKQVARGTSNTRVINIFETEDPKTSMPALQADKDYQELVPERDRIFDLEASTVLMTARMG